MALQQFQAKLAGSKYSKNDKNWFPKWLRRYQRSLRDNVLMRGSLLYGALSLALSANHGITDPARYCIQRPRRRRTHSWSISSRRRCPVHFRSFDQADLMDTDDLNLTIFARFNPFGDVPQNVRFTGERKTGHFGIAV